MQTTGCFTYFKHTIKIKNKSNRQLTNFVRWWYRFLLQSPSSKYYVIYKKDISATHLSIKNKDPQARRKIMVFNFQHNHLICFKILESHNISCLFYRLPAILSQSDFATTWGLGQDSSGDSRVLQWLVNQCINLNNAPNNRAMMVTR